MKTYTIAELNDILKRHEDWLCNRPNGCCADLSYAILSCANLSYANLSYANLSYANLSGADLRCADLSYANLSCANLSCANLGCANLSGAKLGGAAYDEYTAMYALACPEVGSFIGWKKANGCIVKLEITEDALRSSATSRKCRCSKARVLAIETLEGMPANFVSVSSDYDSSFIYKAGEVVSVDNFDTNRWNECAPGIHFFITRDEAVRY